ncbi:hypothetical protein M9H77_29504 [Catharanthus roseus]|uniref:Uncharacterized protein n=1 Tax=Catharanthus roseus TaxID=4058 RepID=A0ACB9ZUL1_CATRO|nr:hypothetical protein M9H77_29504 [Catharanthus roseus]
MKGSENGVVGNKSANLPSLVGSVAQRALAYKDLPWTVGLALLSAVGCAGKRLLSSKQTNFLVFCSNFNLVFFCSSIAFDCNLIVTRLDYSQGCLELKKKEQSKAANWGLIEAID